jgi:hypothetical protein
MIMEKVIAAIIKAIRILLGFFPDNFYVSFKSALSNSVLVIAAARKNPPSSSQIILLEKVFTYRFIFSGEGFKYGLPRANTRYPIIKSATAKAGIASVSHNPIEKNSKNNTYNCETVNEGSLSNQVKPRATTNELRK